MGPSSIRIINAAAFAATLAAGTGERAAFEALFLNGGTLNRNRLADREELLKLAKKDTVSGKPGLLARALRESRAFITADTFLDAELVPGSGEYRAFETLFVRHGSMDQNRLDDRELLLKLKAKDLVGKQPGFVARCLTQFGV